MKRTPKSPDFGAVIEIQGLKGCRAMNESEQLVPSQNRLGETPIWAPEENALYWVDWGGDPPCRFEFATAKLTKFPTPVPVTALARRAAGGWIAVAQTGL